MIKKEVCNMTIDPKNIDPAFEHFKDFSKITGNTTGNLRKMRDEIIFKDGVFPAKYKALMAALWSVSARCEPCLTYYILKAKELGASEREVGETLAVASTMGGCVGETWALKAYQAFKSSKTSDECACDI